MPMYVRRKDEQLVEALQFTEESRWDIRTLFIDAGYACSVGGFTSFTFTRLRPHPFMPVKVRLWDWVVKDGERIYVVPARSFWDHCREAQTE